MNPDDIARALEDARPATPEPRGWGARARRRHRNRRLGGVTAVGVTMVVSMVVLATATDLGQPAVRTTPVPADMPTVTSAPVEELVACAARVAYNETVTTVAEAVHGAFCGTVEFGSAEYVQVQLSDELVADIVAEITTTDTLLGRQPGLDPTASAGLVLMDEAGHTITLAGDPVRQFLWYPPPGTGGIHGWTPSPELASRMLAEITRDGLCTAPPGTASDGTITCAPPVGTGSPSGAATPTQVQPPIHTTTASEPTDPTRPFTSEDVETAWFDDPALAALPSSIREQISMVQDLHEAGGDELLGVEVDLAWGMADIVGINTVWTLEGRGTSSSMDYHRLLGDGMSEMVPDGWVGLEQCVAAHAEFVEKGVVGEEVPSTGMPDQPEFVALCFGGLLEARSRPVGVGTSMLSLGEDRGAQTAVELYNSLPPTEGECELAVGDWGFALYSYGDGSQYFVRVFAGCWTVHAGHDIRGGGEGFRADLWALTEG